MVTKITSFTAHQTAEGMRLTFTYSVINEDGNLVKSNQRATVIVLDEDINTAIGNVNEWLLSKVPV
jgi:hypothetical protein